MDITQRLQNCSREALIKLVNRLQGVHADTDVIIEAHLADTDETTAVDQGLETFKQHLDLILAENDFIDYRHASAFAGRLETLLESACATLGERDSKAALALADYFLSLADQVCERTHDSGEISMLYQEAVNLWLELAGKVRELEQDGETDWVELVLAFFNRNDYGCFDEIIAHSDLLLTEQELWQLARRFENDARNARKQPADPVLYSRSAKYACFGLASVARALQDMALYEKSMLIRSPEPNALQMADIVRFAIEINAFDRARYWLQQPGWEGERREQTRLTNRLLERQGDTDGLKDNLRRAFVEQPDVHLLEAYWKLSDDREKARFRPEAETAARQAGNLTTAVDILLALKAERQAAQLLVERAEELNGIYYVFLTPWAQAFEAANEWLATILCYRALLSDILERGYTKAYHHGARYFHRLLKLDSRQPDYQQFGDARQYIQQLQNKHWRKRSFWNAANYPNKV